MGQQKCEECDEGVMVDHGIVPNSTPPSILYLCDHCDAGYTVCVEEIEEPEDGYWVYYTN